MADVCDEQDPRAENVEYVRDQPDTQTLLTLVNLCMLFSNNKSSYMYDMHYTI